MSVIIIEDADRRHGTVSIAGRAGRGETQSYCLGLAIQNHDH